MRKKLGYFLIGLGAALIISALLLLIYNQWENKQAGETAKILLNDVQLLIEEQPARIESEIEEREEPAEEEESEPMRIAMLNGYEYIGILTIPDLQLKLPVLSNCNADLLKIAPCREIGDLSSGDLVIAAHNYKNHFGYISQLQNGAEVIFTDMGGENHRYEVTGMELFHPESYRDILAKTFDLLLYTCDYTNQNRVAVYCQAITE